MPFTQKIKDEAKWRSAYRCCVCHDVFVEVHHILPEADGGPSTIENAAPLCAKHHDLFGGNPEKRATIRAMRNAWWQEVKEIRAARTDFLERNPLFNVAAVENSDSALLETPAKLYHMVQEHDDFAKTAQTLWSLLKHVQTERPNQPRVLYVDIIGHEGKRIPGTRKYMRWDNQMMELQISFGRTFLLQFFREIHFPLWNLRNDRAQNNKTLSSDELSLFDGPSSHQEALEFAIKHDAELYIGETDMIIRPKRAFINSEMRAFARRQSSGVTHKKDKA